MHRDSCTSRASFVLFDDGARFQTYAHFAAMLHTQGDSHYPTATHPSLKQLHRVRKHSDLPLPKRLEKVTRNESLIFNRIMGSSFAKVKCDMISWQSGLIGS